MPCVPPALHLQLRSSPVPPPSPALSYQPFLHREVRSGCCAFCSERPSHPRLIELLRVPESSAQDNADPLVCAAAPSCAVPWAYLPQYCPVESALIWSLWTLDLSPLRAELRHPCVSPVLWLREAPSGRCFFTENSCINWFSSLSRWCSRKVRDLWWQGIPPSVRGKVWSLAIGNELNITHGECLHLKAQGIAPPQPGPVASPVPLPCCQEKGHHCGSCERPGACHPGASATCREPVWSQRAVGARGCALGAGCLWHCSFLCHLFSRQLTWKHL